MQSLENKIALVTGSAGALGEAIVRNLVKLGMRVVMADIQESRLHELAVELGDRVYPLKLDV
ncbi:MAG: SDR family NAD(P)-dependent oxidoreductase, partial [Pseudomonadales bacterium]|nr:SDR family NAD(P)-dependent oxidoreductase [Pseudomonadales bacterium]